MADEPSPSEPDPSSGRASLPEAAALPDRFEAKEVLGRGGMGVVVCARDRTLGRDVAVKILAAVMRGDRELEARLVREARATASLRHPGIVAVYDVEPDASYIVMELVRGRSLAEILRTDGKQPPDEVRRVGIALADALAAAHAEGIVHRDVKPSNVLVTKSGEVKLTDFGIAFLPDSDLTQPGVYFGTPGYVAPEQARGQIDPRADVYSTGATLFELATGEKLHGSVTSIRDVRGAVLAATADEGLANAIERAVETHPDDRWSSARAFGASLRAKAAEARTARAWLARRKALVASVAIGAAAAGVALGAFLPDGAASPTVASTPEHRANARDGAPVVVAVLPFQNAGDDAELELSTAGLPHLLGLELRRIDGVEVIGHYRLRDLAGEGQRDDVFGTMARRLGAVLLVHGSLLRRGRRVVVEVWTEGLAERRFHATVSDEQLPNTVRGWVPQIAEAALGRPVGAAPQPRPFDVDRALQQAIAALEAHDLVTAQEHLQEAVLADETSADAHYYLALVTWWAGRPPGAIRAHIDHALEGQLDPARRGFLDGLREFVDQDHAGALRSFTRLAARYPGDREAVYGLFEAQFHGGHAREAMATYRRLLEVAPSFRLGSYHVVAYLAAHGDVEGIRWAASALASPGDPTVEATLATCEGDWPRATELLREALDADDVVPGRRVDVLERLVGAYLVVGEIDLAHALLESATPAGSPPSWRLALAIAQSRGDARTRAELRRRAVDEVRSRMDGHGQFLEVIRLVASDVPGASEAEAEELAVIIDETALADHAGDYRTGVAALLTDAVRGDPTRARSVTRSLFAEETAVAAAVRAELEGNHARAARFYEEGASQSTDGTFLFAELDRAAREQRAAGAHAEVRRICERVLVPPTWSWSWPTAARDCLSWTADAADAMGDAPAAAAARARLARMR